MAENGRSVESFLPRMLTTYEIGVPFVNRLFTASASSCTEFVRADHIREKSCSALFGAGAQPERAIAVSAIKNVRMVWMANGKLTGREQPPAPSPLKPGRSRCSRSSAAQRYTRRGAGE